MWSEEWYSAGPKERRREKDKERESERERERALGAECWRRLTW